MTSHQHQSPGSALPSPGSKLRQQMLFQPNATQSKTGTAKTFNESLPAVAKKQVSSPRKPTAPFGSFQPPPQPGSLHGSLVFLPAPSRELPGIPKKIIISLLPLHERLRPDCHSLNPQLSLPLLPLHLFLPKSQDDVGVLQQGGLQGFPSTTSPCSHTDLAQCQAKSLTSLPATSPEPAVESDHNSPGSRCLPENTGEMGMKKQKTLGAHKDNKAPETRERWKIPPPQQTTELSTSA